MGIDSALFPWQQSNKKDNEEPFTWKFRMPKAHLNPPSLASSEEWIVRVTDLSRGGAGVSKDKSGRIVFVPLTAPGDLVRVKVVEQKKRYAQAELLEILEPSPIRKTPRCSVFGKCGGCQWQHLPYELQWETKVKGVKHALHKAGLSLNVETSLFPASKIWEYRNRVQFRGIGSQIGFYRANSHDLVPTDRCMIARSEINEALKDARLEAQEFSRPFKLEMEVRPSGEVRKIWNSPHSAEGFRQIHDEQNEVMKKWISTKIGRGDVLFDLFGGSGNLGIPLSQQIGEIHCVDLSAPLVHPEGVPRNIQFHRSSVLSWLFKRIQFEKRSSPSAFSHKIAIIDPPRSGLGTLFQEISGALETLKVHRMIAIGCDSDSWVRDIYRFVKRGWSVKNFMFIDFFPQTPHIESIALLDL